MEENYTVHCGDYLIRTTITATLSVVRKWIYTIRYRHRFRLRGGRLVVGLGVQWVPGESAAATLQLCVGNDCLIFQLHHADNCPEILRRFLVDPDVIFVGFSNHSDAAMLMRSPHGLEVGRLVDVRRVAHDLRCCRAGASMGELAEEILGMHGMEKDYGVGRSDWDDEELTMDQVNYACHDVFLACLMANELKVWNWEDDD
ncbi:uncharacterized protein LOC131004931 [Salvia miltiorrhiza]|uniref:uncharacterized protein LOC131004931 n=1 Tax=Salvia miltiorrhiza TaxID=226208 RepID=UPI0025ABEA0E|nr:uncharacterized protein LOC131004931 [Salvia miltiorrhiza]